MIELRLFGHFEGRRGDTHIPGLDSGKAGEMFTYLLLHRNRPIGREELASALWKDCGQKQLTKYFSHTMWVLRSRIEEQLGLKPGEYITQSQKYLQCLSDPAVKLDIDIFEQVHILVKDIPASDLSVTYLETIRKAVALYRGDLLLGWYQDWCLFERLRLQGIYLVLLDKLAESSEYTGEFEMGIDWAMTSLRYESACERTNRRLMRLYALSGNRTAALRQYQHYTQILETEFNAQPEPLTQALYQQIKEGSFNGTLRMNNSGSFAIPVLARPIPDQLVQIQTLFKSSPSTAQHGFAQNGFKTD